MLSASDAVRGIIVRRDVFPFRPNKYVVMRSVGFKKMAEFQADEVAIALKGGDVFAPGDVIVPIGYCYASGCNNKREISAGAMMVDRKRWRGWKFRGEGYMVDMIPLLNVIDGNVMRFYINSAGFLRPIRGPGDDDIVMRFIWGLFETEWLEGQSRMVKNNAINKKLVKHYKIVHDPYATDDWRAYIR